MQTGRLVGDVGGTHARFRLLEGAAKKRGVGAADAKAVRHPETYACRDFPSLDAALKTFLDAHNDGAWPEAAAIAVAGPVVDGAVAFTNLGWRVTEDDLARPGRFESAVLLNDFAACALALPELKSADLLALGPTRVGAKGASLAVLGPGTGFGVAALVRDGAGTAVLSGEGGHIAFAPSGERQIDVLRVLSKRFGRVSLERLLSGPGIVDIYDALRALDERGAPLEGPEAVTAAADQGDALANESLEMFAEALGAAAGDFALAYGARGGVFLAGGVALNLKARLAEPGFRKAFEAKGRFAAYLSAIPTWLITHPFPNLLGAAYALAGKE
jgi:glucokinase